MKVFLAYASRYGTTEKCARLLSDILVEKRNEVSLVNLKTDANKNPDGYDLIIIGGSFVAFRMNAFVKKFIKKNMDILMRKKIAVFMCGADDKWEEEIKKGFPEEILDKAIAKNYFGFEMNWDKMNLIVRNMMQKAYKSTEPVSNIKIDNINKFADEITAGILSTK
jgi:menaquinone-dependent protoporphyrinogen oxidase